MQAKQPQRVKDIYGKNDLKSAIAHNNSELVKTILNQPEIDRQDILDAFVYAASSGQTYYSPIIKEFFNCKKITLDELFESVVEYLISHNVHVGKDYSSLPREERARLKHMRNSNNRLKTLIMDFVLDPSLGDSYRGSKNSMFVKLIGVAESYKDFAFIKRLIEQGLYVNAEYKDSKRNKVSAFSAAQKNYFLYLKLGEHDKMKIQERPNVGHELLKRGAKIEPLSARSSNEDRGYIEALINDVVDSLEERVAEKLGGSYGERLEEILTTKGKKKAITDEDITTIKNFMKKELQIASTLIATISPLKKPSRQIGEVFISANRKAIDYANLAKQYFENYPELGKSCAALARGFLEISQILLPQATHAAFALWSAEKNKKECQDELAKARQQVDQSLSIMVPQALRDAI